VETLLQNTPATTSLFSKRLAMEAVSSTLRSYMFEEIVPLSIIQKRPVASRDQFLVSWFDGNFHQVLLRRLPHYRSRVWTNLGRRCGRRRRSYQRIQSWHRAS